MVNRDKLKERLSVKATELFCLLIYECKLNHKIFQMVSCVGSIGLTLPFA